MNRDIIILLLVVLVVVLLLRGGGAGVSSGVRITPGAYGTQIDYGTEAGGGRCG